MLQYDHYYIELLAKFYSHITLSDFHTVMTSIYWDLIFVISQNQSAAGNLIQHLKTEKPEHDYT